MARALLILFVSWAYVGCAAVIDLPRRGAAVRWLPADPVEAAAVRRAELSAQVIAGAQRRRGPAASGECWRVALDDGAKFADGRPVQAIDLIRAWEERLRDASAPHRFLLGPVEGSADVVRGAARRVHGLSVDGASLVVCVSRPTPDLVPRLSHPALWPEGCGPFVADAGTLLPNPGYGADGPRIGGITEVPRDGSDPALRIGVDDVDLAVVYARAAGRLLESKPGTTRLTRLPRWDRRYVLWLNPRARWVNDPTFRRWLGAKLERESMLAHVFDGRGVPLFALASGDSAARAPSAAVRRPFSTGSAPRLPLYFDANDPFAAAAARRIRANLELHGVTVRLHPRPAAELARDLAAGRQELAVALLAHQPQSDDPLLALGELLHRLDDSAAEARQRLDRASRSASPDERVRGAGQAEDLLLDAATLVPLLRLDAWLATRRELQLAHSGPFGVLGLNRAWWKP